MRRERVTKRCVLGLFCIVLLTGSLFALDIDIKKLASKLDPEIQKMMQEGKVASATMALISGNIPQTCQSFYDQTHLFQLGLHPYCVFGGEIFWRAL